MRLLYSILCIDDQIDSLRDLQDDVEDWNRQVGIETEYINVPVIVGPRMTNDDEIVDHFSREVEEKIQINNPDIILIDLHLGRFDGHRLIEVIRDQTIYRPIIFYSAGRDKTDESATSDLTRALSENGLIGKSVFISARGRKLSSDLKRICSEMHKQEHGINASRGLLMDRTSEIDAMVLEKISNEDIWNKIPEDRWCKVFDDISNIFETKYKNNEKFLENGIDKEVSDYSNVVDWFTGKSASRNLRNMDSMTKNKVLRIILKCFDTHAEENEIFKAYFNDVNGEMSLSKMRNIYAHQTANLIEKTHGEDVCKKIREHARTHEKNIVNIVSSI